MKTGIKGILVSVLVGVALLMVVGKPVVVLGEAVTGEDPSDQPQETTSGSQVVVEDATGGYVTTPVIEMGNTTYVTHLYNDEDELIAGRALAQGTDWFVNSEKLNLMDGSQSWRVSAHDWVRDSDVKFHFSMDPNQVVPDMQKLTINFVDTAGNVLRAPENVTVAFDFTSELKKAVLPITGYDLARTDATKPGEFTYIYQKKAPAENGGGTAVTTPPTTVTPTPSISEPTDPVKVVPKGQAVSAFKRIGLYRTVNFNRQTRLHWYAKRPRNQWPQFVVTGYRRNTAGVMRYRVRDVNHQSKTDGLTGYVTASDNDVTSTYFRVTPRHVRVLNPLGINAYRQADLSGRRLQHFKRGTVLKVKAIRHYHLTTRLVLTGGRYMTANKTLVVKK
ncbi:DUF5776 domain-containing protein [Levilactobacillus lanxiensis]|uniref:DUF5776 domain-containing protein n=1 Tax=Levilactobacillus lanxiensis TaxID=2799568 RepID=A0ABW4D0R7_9LACO|nr:DUF5776 domain-containing protein [Levilactobacillus lanxiensis]